MVSDTAITTTTNGHVHNKTLARRALGWLRGEDIGRELEQKWSLTLGGNAQPPNYGNTWLSGNYDYSYAGRDDFYKGATLIDNSAVMACIQWIMRAFPEAPCVVRRRTDLGMEIIEDHPLTWLLDSPNQHYSGAQLWQATVLSLNLCGNAYWLKVRNGEGRGPTRELWYEPHYTIRAVPARSGNRGH